MSRQLSRREEMRRLRTCGNKLFGRVNGSLEVGPFRSSSRPHHCNSSPKRPADLVINSLSSNRSTKLRGFLFLHFEALPYLSLALNRNLAGQRAVRQHARKIGHTLSWAFLKSQYRLCMEREEETQSDGWRRRLMIPRRLSSAYG